MLLVALLSLVNVVASVSPVDPSEIQSWVSKRGYPFETHAAATEDGLRLMMFRIPRNGAPVIHLQHGILDSAWAWVFNSEFKPLAFELYDAGYDVWLGNSRGNGFSMFFNNGSDPSRSDSFWDFTFEKMALLDIPAMLGTVLNVTGQSKVAYIAHSQGTTQMFVAASLKTPLQGWLQEHISVFIALSPVAWLGHTSSLLLKTLSDLRIQKIVSPLFSHGFFGPEWRKTASIFCTLTAGVICKIGVDVVCGHGPLDPSKNVELYASFFPFGTSFKDITHFAQEIVSDQFARYDYGQEGNEAHYGQLDPPPYDVQSLTVPTALFVGDEDDLADVRDVQTLKDTLGKSPQLVFSKTYPGFSHITWTLGSASASYYVSDIMGLLKSHHPAVDLTAARNSTFLL